MAWRGVAPLCNARVGFLIALEAVHDLMAAFPQEGRFSKRAKLGRRRSLDPMLEEQQIRPEARIVHRISLAEPSRPLLPFGMNEPLSSLKGQLRAPAFTPIVKHRRDQESVIARIVLPPRKCNFGKRRSVALCKRRRYA